MTRFAPAGPLRGSLRPPSDKSISHRAALIAAMAEGETLVDDYLDAADTRSTLAAVQALGAEVAVEGPGGSAPWAGPAEPLGPRIRIRGVGLRGDGGAAAASPASGGNPPSGSPPGPRSAAIDVGNAGTLLRLLPGWLAGQPGGEWTLDGDDSIRRRPVDRIAAPLRQMGADLAAREERLPPLTVRGAALRGVEYEMPVASAQVKSCLLFAGLLAEGSTTVVETHPSRDHTERMLAAAGARIDRKEHRGGGLAVTVHPTERLGEAEIGVPADVSSAAFFLIAASLVAGSEVVLDQVNINPTRTGILAILTRMGAEIEVEPEDEPGGEPLARLRVRSAPLRGTEVGGAEVPLAIDELPLVALAACFAEGTTTIRDAAELRRKETDRVETVTAALTALGGRAEATPDGMVVEGTGGLRGGRISSHGDHRIAMLGAISGLASAEGVEVEGMDAAAVSYPGFEADLGSLLGAP